MSDPTNIDFGARARIGARTLDDAAIRDIELTRARSALAYLKDRIGNGAMRDLLKEDTDRSQVRTREWVRASSGRWKWGSLELTVPDPRAATFHEFFMTMMKEDRQPELRAGHPEHFMNVPLGPHAEVIENVGQDDLPWFIRLDFTPPDAEFPAPWDPAYPPDHRLGAFINDADGLRIGSAIHEMRDAADGLQIKLTVILPDAAPDALVEGHLRHFAVEFRNWTRAAQERSQLPS